MSQVQVIATERGYDGVRLRDVGDVFLADEKLLGNGKTATGAPIPKSTWFKRASQKPAPQKEPEQSDQTDATDLT